MFQDYEAFDIANEDDVLEEFLGLPRKTPKVSNKICLNHFHNQTKSKLRIKFIHSYSISSYVVSNKQYADNISQKIPSDDTEPADGAPTEKVTEENTTAKKATVSEKGKCLTNVISGT